MIFLSIFLFQFFGLYSTRSYPIAITKSDSLNAMRRLSVSWIPIVCKCLSDLSDITPFAMNVFIENMPVFSTNFLMFELALPLIQPFPTKIIGILAFNIISTAFFIKPLWGLDLNVRLGFFIGLIFDLSLAISSGSSKCTAPVFSSIEILNALLTNSGITSALWIDHLHFVIGLNIDTTSIF